MDLNNVEFTWIKNKPMNWKIHRVKNHFVLTKNKTDSPEGYPILSLTMRGIIERDISSNEGQLPETYNGYNLLEKDDIVFNPMDLISGWVDCSPHEGLISPSYKVIRPTSSEVDIKFYTYYFQTHYKEKIFFPFGEGVHYEYRWGLGTETLKNFPIVVPPLLEQQQIVSFLDTKTSLIDSLIEKTQRKIELLKEKRTSLINEVVTKGLNPNVEMKDSGVEWIGEIPSNWGCFEFKFVINLLTDFESNGSFKSVKENVKVLDDIGPVWYVRMTDLENNNIRNDKCKYCDFDTYEFLHKTKLDGGELLITKRGEIGKVYIFPNDSGISTLGPNSYLLKLDESEVSPNFLFYFYKSDFGQITLKLMDKSTTIGSIYKDDLKNSKVIIPPLSEQQQIVDYLDEYTQRIDKTISIEEKRIELLKEYRQSLISEVVTGKRKVVE